jgi:hypothetical protein
MANLKDRIERSMNETNRLKITQYLNTILHDVRDVCFRSKNVNLKDLNKVENQIKGLCQFHLKQNQHATQLFLKC